MATFDKPLWQPRSPEETKALYTDWAKTYDSDVTGAGYATPGRVARALAEVADLTAPLLDFGCGTGLSGVALAAEGFTAIDGVGKRKEVGGLEPALGWEGNGLCDGDVGLIGFCLRSALDSS